MAIQIEYTPADFYDELLSVADAAGADPCRAYAALGAVLRRAVDQRLLHSSLAFAGMFAKVDYLLKEHRVEPALASRVNDARARLRRYAECGSDELRLHFPHDLKSVCLFIAAVYGGAAVPPPLALRLPRRDLSVGGGDVLGDRVRVAVASCDGTTVTATSERGATLRVDCSGPWAGVCGLLSRGSQLNLVRPRMESGIVKPELVIFEPDYLVDISSVAACFQPYGESPFTYLLNIPAQQDKARRALRAHAAGQPRRAVSRRGRPRA